MVGKAQRAPANSRIIRGSVDVNILQLLGSAFPAAAVTMVSEPRRLIVTAKKPAKKIGVVKSFNEKRGVGFIKDGKDEFTVHYSDIELPGYANLESGQFVEFEASDGDAKKVRPTETS
jgi:cold shock CspA family protein